MTDWLIKKFVKNWEDTKNQKVRERYGILGSVTGVGLNLLLSFVKILLGFLCGSVSVTADGVNNLSDAGAGLVSLVSVRMAQKPIDEDHPFGHGRMEYLGALGVGVLIAVFGVELLISAAENILYPKTTAFSWLTVVLLVVGMAVKFWMSRFYRALGTRTDNPTLLAASKDSLSDVLATGAVTVSALVTLLLGWPIDGFVGAIVSLLVLKAAWDVLRDTVTRLLGGKPDRELGRQIVEIVTRDPGVLGVHDLVIHDYGPGRAFASIHAEVAADSDLVQIHEVIDHAEREVAQELQIPICIHMDPILTGDEKTEAAKAAMQAYLGRMDPPLKLHDFRRVPGNKQINLVFDVLLPHDFRNEDSLRSGICAHARTLDPRYNCVVHFDRDYFQE